MTQTNNLKINLVEQSQSQKEVTINEAVFVLEALQNRGVTDKDLSAPPLTPADGSIYIIASSPTGEWVGKANQLAYFNSGWKFIVPNEGLILWVNDEDMAYVYDGNGWNSFANGLDTVSKLGINATADTTNRLAVESEAVLFTANSSGNIRMNFNKTSASNTATVIFQNAYSGRAEMGLAGDDDFKFKVSADGSAWNTALTINRTNAQVNLDNGVSVGAGDAVKKVLTATANLDFPSIAINTAADLTMTVTGAVVGNSTVQLGLTSAPTAGIIYSAFVSAANTVTVRAANFTAAAINPASQSFRVSVLVF